MKQESAAVRRWAAIHQTMSLPARASEREMNALHLSEIRFICHDTTGTDTCTLVEYGDCNGGDSLRPIATDDFYWKVLDIHANFTDTTLFGGHFECWSEPSVDLCCLPDFTSTVAATFPGTAGATGGFGNLFIACGAFADSSLDGCSIFECFEYVFRSVVELLLRV